MYAVVKTGGKQYKVSPGDVLNVEKLTGDVGESVTLSEVLLVSTNSDLKVGRSTVPGASVTCTIVDQTRADKIIVFKKKRRKGYDKKYGHRQPLTVLKVENINI